jgi:hypothetical protein
MAAELRCMFCDGTGRRRAIAHTHECTTCRGTGWVGGHVPAWTRSPFAGHAKLLVGALPDAVSKDEAAEQLTRVLDATYESGRAFGVTTERAEVAATCHALGLHELAKHLESGKRWDTADAS